MNTASNSISRYAIDGAGDLALFGSTPLGPGVAGAEDARLAPDGRSLWVVDTGVGKVSGFAVDDGSLQQFPSSPTTLPTGPGAFGIVVD